VTTHAVRGDEKEGAEEKCKGSIPGEVTASALRDNYYLEKGALALPTRRADQGE
jgi:hypothetical protein